MSHRTGVKFEPLELVQKIISAQIRAINLRTDLDADQKAVARHAIDVTHKEMAEVINQFFKRPIDTDDVHTKEESVPLDPDIKAAISPDRPSDVPRSKSKKK